MHGSDTYNRPSRFVSEIPEQLIEEIRSQNTLVRPVSPAMPKSLTSFARDADVDGTDLKLGQRVIHAKFGEGTVVNYEGAGKQARIQVNFVGAGSKWLMMAYAKLESVG